MNNYIDVGDVCLYKYAPSELETSYTQELKAISEKEPYCEVTEFIGHDENDNELFVVDFSVEQNEGKALPYTGDYIVYGKELTKFTEPVLINDDEKTTAEESITSVKNAVAEAVSVNAEQGIIDSSLEDYPAVLVAIESEKDAEITYKTLLDIEKNSETPNQEVIDLLEHILNDELEHIALLSAYAAKQNSEHVEGEKSKEMFNDYVEETVDSID